MEAGSESKSFRIYQPAMTSPPLSSISRRALAESCTGIASYVLLSVRGQSFTDRKLKAEWGIVYAGSVLISAVDENGNYEARNLNYGDIWYFPKGVAHTIQGLEDENEYLLVFDDGDFDKAG
jgi:hypothetical protein